MTSEDEDVLLNEYNLRELFMSHDEENINDDLEYDVNTDATSNGILEDFEEDIRMQEIIEQIEMEAEQQTLLKEEEVKLSEKFEILLNIFPTGDIEFMRQKCIEFKDRDEEFEIFIHNSLASNNFPKNELKGQIARKINLINAKSLESFQCSLQIFLNRIKDPVDYFLKCPRDLNYKNKVVEYLKDKFRIIKESRIRQVATENEFKLLQCVHYLESTPPKPQDLNDVPRAEEEILEYDNEVDDFLYEVEFVKHKERILDYMKIQQELKEFALEKGKILGELLECECCFDKEVLAEDVVTCTNGHVFCKECFQRGVDITMEEAKIEFPCFQECSGKFTMDSIKKVLSTQAYNKLLSRIQYREVTAAEIEGMEFCLYCDYGAIPDRKADIFHCEKCFAKICRKCNKDDHYPRKCNESEEEYLKTKARIASEEQQTYNVVRICRKCKVEFIKLEGCNKMVCSNCGTMLCYICRQIITGYDHFNSGTCNLHPQ